MKEDIDKEKLEKKQLQNIRGEMQNLRSDIQEVKTTWKNDKPNATRKTKYTLSQQKNKIALLVALAIPAWFVLGLEVPTIPEWVFVVGSGLVAGVIVGYIPAKYVVDRFVKDTRKPVLEIDAKQPNDIALWYVPEERIPDIEVYEGEKQRFNTKKGTGYEFKRFEKVVSEGKEHLIGKGTWIGSKSGLELKRDIMNIQAMEKTLKPKAQIGFAYEVMWPHIMREVQSSVGNQMARSFEEVSVFKSDEVRNEVDKIIEQYKPENITEEVDENDIDEIDNKTNGEVDKDQLQKILN